jgi:hypothetical protein
MNGRFLRLLTIGLAALLLAAPLAAQLPAEVQDDASELEELAGPGDAPARGPELDARLLGGGDSSVRGSFDSTRSSLTLSRPPPETVR